MSNPALEKAKILSILKHDMNNVLTGVKTGLEIMAMDDFFEDEDNAEDLNDVKKASIRMANMLEDLSLLFGDDPELRAAQRGIPYSDLKTKIVDQLDLEGIELNLKEEPAGGVEIQTNPETLVRAIFYGALLLNEIERSGVSLEVSSDGSLWSFFPSPSQGESLSSLLEESQLEERPSFLLKVTELAAARLGGAWSLQEGRWSLSLKG